MKRQKMISCLSGLVILCMFMLPASAYQFSMTNVENYDSLDDLYPDGTTTHANVYGKLTGQGWTQAFYDADANVNDPDFATSGGGLNNVDLHYHYSHGDWQSGTTYVQYSNWPTSSLSRTEVYKKWGTSPTSAIKWVVLQSCWVLRDLQWGGALKYSHGILGFGGIARSDPDLASHFFENCINNDYTIAFSWQRATQDVFEDEGTLVRVIFDTNDQVNNDHLPGHGTVAASETTDDDTIYWDEWNT